MITFLNAVNFEGQQINVQVASEEDKTINADGLLAFPAVIDPHVHFRTPGMEYKEDWRTGAKAAIRGGCTLVFDMPNTVPPTITADLLEEKKQLIDTQLREAGIPLRYELFFGADKQHLQEIPLVKDAVVGIKIFMGCSTGNLVIDDDESLRAAFELAARENMLIAVHAEDEHLIHARKASFTGELNYHAHSQIRNVDVAVKAVEKAIALTRRYGTRLYILHMSTAEELALVKAAKAEGLPVFAETTPHHLFFDDSAYEVLGGKAVVNPPLRDKKYKAALFQAIHDGVIDTIGSDHAPHTLDEKNKPYGQCPSGMPGIEFMLPLLFTAYHQGLLSLQEIHQLTSARARNIFHVPDYQDWVFVDLNKTARVNHTESKCAWTPYHGMELQGWPVYTTLRGKVFTV